MKETLLVKHAVGGRTFIESVKQQVTYTVEKSEAGWRFELNNVKGPTIEEILKWKEELNVFLFQDIEGQPTKKIWFYVKDGPVTYDAQKQQLTIVAQSRIEYVPDQFGESHMLADITQTENGYIARFERYLKHPVEQVWAWLTENDKLAQWFFELRVDDLREGGVIKFDMQDGTFEELEITELAMYSVLAYTWGKDRVRFELSAESEGCRLVLIETIAKLTDHTPKDLAGWHVCLDVIQALLDGRTIESRHNEWKAWYEKYTQRMENFPKN